MLQDSLLRTLLGSEDLLNQTTLRPAIIAFQRGLMSYNTPYMNVDEMYIRQGACVSNIPKLLG